MNLAFALMFLSCTGFLSAATLCIVAFTWLKFGIAWVALLTFIVSIFNFGGKNG